MKKISILLSTAMFWLLPTIAFASEGGEGGATTAGLGAALAIGVAAFGGALGQGKAGAAALEGIARNPNAAGKLFVPMIICLALIESLVIYALLIAFVKY